jgi:hypothetical protein
MPRKSLTPVASMIGRVFGSERFRILGLSFSADGSSM